MKENHIRLIFVIGLWLPVIFFASSLIDNKIICDIFWDDDKDNNLERCFNGESDFGFITLMGLFLLLATPATFKTGIEWESHNFSTVSGKH